MTAPIQSDSQPMGSPPIQMPSNTTADSNTAANSLTLEELNRAAIATLPSPTRLGADPEVTDRREIEASVTELSQRANTYSTLGVVCEFMKKLGADIREKLGTLAESMKKWGGTISVFTASIIFLGGAVTSFQISYPYLLAASVASEARKNKVLLFKEIFTLVSLVGFIPAVLSAALTHLCLKSWVKLTASSIDNWSGESHLKDLLHFAKETNIFLLVLTMTDDTIFKRLFPDWDLEKKIYPGRVSSLEHRIHRIETRGDEGVPSEHNIRRYSTTRTPPQFNNFTS